MLIQPFRDRVERCEAECRRALEALDDDLKLSMGYDSAVDALDRMDLMDGMDRVGLVAHDLRSEIRDAAECRRGFDTWSRRERDNFIVTAGELALLFGRLAEALLELNAAERSEIRAMLTVVEI